MTSTLLTTSTKHVLASDLKSSALSSQPFMHMVHGQLTDSVNNSTYIIGDTSINI